MCRYCMHKGAKISPAIQGHSDIVQLEEEFFQINKGQDFVRTDFINVTRKLSNIRDGNS